MKDYKERIDKLLSDAEDCALIGNMATDPVKRAAFRKLAQQFRVMAVQLKAQMKGEAPPPSEDEFLLEQAKRCRDLVNPTLDQNVGAELLRLAAEFERKALP